MKKSIKNLALGLLLAFTALPFISCGHEPVFYGIMHDVPPETATISGNITSIVRCTVNSDEYLFISSGDKLRYKTIDSSKHGEWSSENIVLPFKAHHYNYYATSTESSGHQGEQILRVLADESNIYLLTASFKQDNQYGVVMPEKFSLWTKSLDSLFNKDASDWENLVTGREDYFPFKLDVYETETELDFALFFTNTIKAEHRKAFLSVTKSDGTKYYELKGSAEPQDCTSTATGGNCLRVNSNTEKVNSAFYIGGELYFTDSHIVITDETASKNSTLALLAGIGTNNYSTSELFIYRSGDTEPTKHTTVGSTIASLALTANSLIIGKGSYGSSYTSNGGIERILVDSTDPDNKIIDKETTPFDNNATYQFTTSYIVMTLLCVDPTLEEADSTLYASISYRGSSSSSAASFKDVGLWSYYPSRGNWNRE